MSTGLLNKVMSTSTKTGQTKHQEQGDQPLFQLGAHLPRARPAVLFQHRCSHQGSRDTWQNKQDFTASISAPSSFTSLPTAAPGWQVSTALQTPG